MFNIEVVVAEENKSARRMMGVNLSAKAQKRNASVTLAKTVSTLEIPQWSDK